VILRLLDLAEKDLLDGFRFYQRPPNPVGAYFLDSIYSDIESLRLYAGIHRKFSGYHRLLSKRFPFAIYYKIEGDQVAIWRVLDCRRDPRWIEKQLSPIRRQKR
jgi:plasmid stabilization system protein ParE